MKQERNELQLEMDELVERLEGLDKARDEWTGGMIERMKRLE